ncbi:1154_t:CDS:1, partial [Dentiscutata heterogama]
KSNIEQVSIDNSNLSISIEFSTSPNEIFSLEIVAGMICSEEALELSGSLFFSPPLFIYESVLLGPSG